MVSLGSDSSSGFQAPSVTTDDIKASFLAFCKRNGHLDIGGFSVILQNDPTLLFINSGMAPLKGFFLGEVSPPQRLLCNVQLCIRTTDIESVGDDYHLTAFEMMGNWQIGGLVKREALAFAWGLVSDMFALRKEDVVVTYYGGDCRYPNIPSDEESRDIWRKLGFESEKIVPLGAADNLWGPPGKSGPCGPCTEIFIDRGVEAGRSPDEKPDSDSGRFIEVWNAGVFMAYHAAEDGAISDLPLKSLDAGAGVERWAMILQGVTSVYDTDALRPIMDVIVAAGGSSQGSRAVRIMTDHIRTATFLLGEGVRPGNQKMQYVLRRLIRRAVVQAVLTDTPLGALAAASDWTIEVASHWYPFLVEQRDSISAALKREVDSFARALSRGRSLLRARLGVATNGVLRGEDAFRMKETYGIPLEVTEELAAAEGFSVDVEGYEAHMARHREISRPST